MKNINIKNSIILVLCITIICMGIGFVVLSIELKSKQKETSIFDIIYTDVEIVSSIKGAKKEPSGRINIKSNGKVLDMNFSLNNPNDELIYIVTIKNAGNISGEVIDIIESPEYSSKYMTSIAPVKITYTDVKGKILEPDEETQMKIKVTYDKIETPKKIVFNEKLAIIAESR